MPSKSYINFLHLQRDVSDLTATHFSLSGGTRGRKRLGFLTRSAVVMLCAAWERYNEDLILECVDLMAARTSDANSLPLEIKKSLSNRVKNVDKNELSPMDLAGDGWKQLWKSLISDLTEGLNTPKGGQLNELFRRYVGIPSYTNLWPDRSSAEIDDIITTRGEIAHRGSQAQYVRMDKLKNNIDTVISTSIEIDSNVAGYLQAYLGLADPPWDLAYHRTLGDFLASL